MGKHSIGRSVALCLAGLLLSATVQSSPLPDPCTDATLAGTGEFAQFNREQCRRANLPLRTQQPQEGDTCVCEALLNAAFDLGVTGTIADIRKLSKCDGAVFSALFTDFSRADSPLAGRVFGGAVGAIASKSLVSTNDAIKQIEEALADGHVVAVALNARPIYDYYAQRLNVSYSGLGVTGGHALVLRAVIKGADGAAKEFIVVDSSGPGRLYSVPADILREAYGSPVAILGRGVYISKATRP